MLETGVPDLRVREKEAFQILETGQVLKARIPNLRVVEKEISEVGETAQVLKARIRHSGVDKIEVFQVGGTAQTLEASVRDLRVGEIDIFQVGEAQVLQGVIRNPDVALKINHREVGESRRALLSEGGDDEIMKPHWFAWFCFDECPNLLEVLELHLLPVHAPPAPETGRRHDHQERDSEQATRGGEPDPGPRRVVRLVGIRHAISVIQPTSSNQGREYRDGQPNSDRPQVPTFALMQRSL